MSTTNIPIDIEDIKSKLLDKFRDSGWTSKLKAFLVSEDFDNIIKALIKEKDEGYRFTPPLKTMFSAFENCNYSNLKVVIIGQEPNEKIGYSDGMSFSTSSDVPDKTSEILLNAVHTTVYPTESNYENNQDLSRWASQGVLLINTALTTRIDKSGKHFNIWKAFIAYLLDILNTHNSGLIFIFMGNKAQELEDLINENVHHKFLLKHPLSALSYGNWDCQDVFNKTNEILKLTNNESIKW